MKDQLFEQLAARMKQQVEEELDDPNFQEHWHGRPIGYNKGCKGPLCTKMQLERIRPKGAKPRNPLNDEMIDLVEAVVREDRKKKDERTVA